MIDVTIDHAPVSVVKIVAGTIKLEGGSVTVNLKEDEGFPDTDYVVHITPISNAYVYKIDRFSKTRRSFKIMAPISNDAGLVYYLAIGGEKYA